MSSSANSKLTTSSFVSSKLNTRLARFAASVTFKLTGTSTVSPASPSTVPIVNVATVVVANTPIGPTASKNINMDITNDNIFFMLQNPF